MRISILIISGASLLALGGIAKADDHLYQAVTFGGLGGNVNQQATVKSDAPGRGSPFTAFDRDEDLGTPSTGTLQAHHDQKQPPADPHCAGCSLQP